MSVTETRAYDDNGFNSHSKHYIARGGRSNFANAQSPANLWESWMVPWQAVIDAGTQWIMLNKGTGLTPGVQVYMDKVSMDYLRNELGYDGIACLDWPLDVDVLTSQTGITVDGVDISELDIEEIYALMLNVGVDAISAMGTFGGTDTTLYANSGFYRAFPDFIVKAVEDGLVTQECLDEHVIRILKNKFDLGIFEDPYSDWEEALALIGNETYQAEQTLPMTNEEIDALRRPEIIEMESQLMVESTILLKNENVLPLTEGVKLYVMSNNSNIQEADVAALGAYGTVVETMDEADYIIGHVTAFDENFDYLVEDAQAADKPIILIWEGTVGRNGAQGDPYLAQVDPCAAVLMQTYNNTPDHGSSMGAFYRYVTPSITADMLFGVKEPGGSTVFEIPLTAEDAALSWGDLQMDMGVDNATRLYMAMLARENPSILMPNNLGDVLYTTNFGMNYSDPADIELSLLTVPEAVLTVEVDGKETTEVAAATQTAGVPFEINFVAKNNGGDGHVTAQIMEGDTVLAEKFVAVDGGQFRVITMEITLDAGEHTISLGDMSTTIVVE